MNSAGRLVRVPVSYVGRRHASRTGGRATFLRTIRLKKKKNTKSDRSSLKTQTLSVFNGKVGRNWRLEEAGKVSKVIRKKKEKEEEGMV